MREQDAEADGGGGWKRKDEGGGGSFYLCGCKRKSQRCSGGHSSLGASTGPQSNASASAARGCDVGAQVAN
eukprot:1519509-Pyramimonas_sp.AAC.1